MAASAIIEDLGKKPPVPAITSIPGEDSLVLSLVIEDPEVGTELRRPPRGMCEMRSPSPP